MKSPAWLIRILSWVLPLLVPPLLLLTAVRLLLTPTFVRLEYHMPGFPADSYGFTQEDRLHWAPIALDYLLNDQGISFLGDLTFDNGTPLYNSRELGHMQDVKALTQIFLRVWLGGLALFVALGLWARFGDWWPDFRRILANGGLLTMGLIAALGLLLALSFDAVFVGFHRIFFEGDTWLFQFSDTLIRLFPLRFWQDVFIFVASFTFLAALALWLLTRARPVKPTLRSADAEPPQR